MEHFGFNTFDLAALAVLALSGIMAFARGLIREVFSVIAFIGACFASIFFSEIARPLVEAVTSLRGGVAAVAGGLLVFLVIFIAITVVISMVAKQAHQSTEIGSFDRAAGLAFGILRGILIVSLLVLLLIHTSGKTDNEDSNNPVYEWVHNGRTYPIYGGVANALDHFLPRARADIGGILERRQHTESSVATTEVTPPPQAPSTTTTVPPAGGH